MSIKRRIGKLELIRPACRNCSECGYPERAVTAVLLTDQDNPAPTCKRCDQPLNENGVPMHAPYAHIILA